MGKEYFNSGSTVLKIFTQMMEDIIFYTEGMSKPIFLYLNILNENVVSKNARTNES